MIAGVFASMTIVIKYFLLNERFDTYWKQLYLIRIPFLDYSLTRLVSTFARAFYRGIQFVASFFSVYNLFFIKVGYMVNVYHKVKQGSNRLTHYLSFKVIH